MATIYTAVTKCNSLLAGIFYVECDGKEIPVTMETIEFFNSPENVEKLKTELERVNSLHEQKSPEVKYY